MFIVLHGLVHVLYFGLSQGYFTLDTPIGGWPERSWALAGLLTPPATRAVASTLYLLATALFVVSGAAIIVRANWWSAMLVGAALFSSAVVVLFWDGKMRQLPDKGFVGVLINVVVLAVVYWLNARPAAQP
jgi:hypothetical protein